jgi:phage terminase large subunit
MLQPFNPSPVFEWNFTAKQRIVINQGGTSSGKTYSILQVLLIKICEAAQYHKNIVATVAGQDMPNLRDGTARELDKILNNDFFGSMISKVNRSTLKYHFHNGAVLEFKSYDNEQDARNGKRHFLFVNEAQGLSFEIFEQLQTRTSIQTFIDYNPSAPFWVHHNLIGAPEVVRFISNYNDNGYLNESGAWVSNLPEAIIKNIESKKDRPQWWRVYGLGLTGQVSGVVFPDINFLPSIPPPEDCKRTVYGLDWGYDNDPTTLVRASIYEGELYAEGLLYETGLKYHQIAAIINELGVDTQKYDLIADNDSRGIDTLKDYGVYSTKAKKGANSIIEGIQIIKEYKLNILNNLDWKTEQLSYIYKTDRRTGKPNGSDPKDDYNHYWDALRYAMEKLHRRKGGGGILAKSY